MKASLFINHTF